MDLLSTKFLKHASKKQKLTHQSDKKETSEGAGSSFARNSSNDHQNLDERSDDVVHEQQLGEGATQIENKNEQEEFSQDQADFNRPMSILDIDRF